MYTNVTKSFIRPVYKCHKNLYKTILSYDFIYKTDLIKNFSGLSEDERNIFLRRSRVKSSVADSENLWICFHHEEKWGSIFEEKNYKCCNIKRSGST